MLALLAVASAAIMPAFFTAIPVPVRIIAASILGAALVGGFRRAGWLAGSRTIDSVVWDAEGRWFLSNSGEAWEAHLCGESWINGRAMLLRWKAVEGKKPPSSMLLTVADVGPFVFRRLGIRLRIDGLGATTASDSLLA